MINKKYSVRISPNLVFNARELQGLTQEQFAKELGVSTVLISMVETGIKPVTLKLLGQISGIFKQRFVIDINGGKIRPSDYK